MHEKYEAINTSFLLGSRKIARTLLRIKFLKNPKMADTL